MLQTSNLLMTVTQLLQWINEGIGINGRQRADLIAATTRQRELWPSHGCSSPSSRRLSGLENKTKATLGASVTSVVTKRTTSFMQQIWIGLVVLHAGPLRSSCCKPRQAGLIT